MLYGRNLNEIHKILASQRLMESDETIRRLERAAAGGDQQAQAAHGRAMKRAGRAHEYMKPHMDEFRAAQDDHMGEIMMNNNPEKKRAAAIRHRDARKAMHRAAGHVDEHPGLFYDRPELTGKWPVSDRSRLEKHASNLAILHGAHRRRYDRNGGHAAFESPEGRASFIKSLQHHYPDSEHKTRDSKLGSWTGGKVDYEVDFSHGVKLRKHSKDTGEPS